MPPSWCPASTEPCEELIVQFEEPMLVTEVVVQGRFGGPHWGYPKTFRFEYMSANTGGYFVAATVTGSGSIVGPPNQFNYRYASRELDNPVEGTHFRFKILEKGGARPSMRFDLLGCPVPAGRANSLIGFSPPPPTEIWGHVEYKYSRDFKIGGGEGGLRTYLGAVQDCVARGMRLARIIDDRRDDGFQKMAQKLSTSFPRAWVGLSTLGPHQDGEWKWAATGRAQPNGPAASKDDFWKYWAVGNPKAISEDMHPGLGKCVAMGFAIDGPQPSPAPDSSAAQLHDMFCHDKSGLASSSSNDICSPNEPDPILPYFCEAKKPTPPPSAPAPVIVANTFKVEEASLEKTQSACSFQEVVNQEVVSVAAARPSSGRRLAEGHGHSRGRQLSRSWPASDPVWGTPANQNGRDSSVHKYKADATFYWWDNGVDGKHPHVVNGQTKQWWQGCGQGQCQRNLIASQMCAGIRPPGSGGGCYATVKFSSSGRRRLQENGGGVTQTQIGENDEMIYQIEREYVFDRWLKDVKCKSENPQDAVLSLEYVKSILNDNKNNSVAASPGPPPKFTELKANTEAEVDESEVALLSTTRLEAKIEQETGLETTVETEAAPAPPAPVVPASSQGQVEVAISFEVPAAQLTTTQSAYPFQNQINRAVVGTVQQGESGGRRLAQRSFPASDPTYGTPANQNGKDTSVHKQKADATWYWWDNQKDGNYPNVVGGKTYGDPNVMCGNGQCQRNRVAMEMCAGMQAPGKSGGCYATVKFAWQWQGRRLQQTNANGEVRVDMNAGDTFQYEVTREYVFDNFLQNKHESSNNDEHLLDMAHITKVLYANQATLCYWPDEMLCPSNNALGTADGAPTFQELKANTESIVDKDTATALQSDSFKEAVDLATGFTVTVVPVATEIKPHRVAARKDPHLHFAHGGRADLRGEDGAVFNFLSAKNVSMNVKTTKDDFVWSRRLVHGTKMATAYWTIRTSNGRMLRMEYNATHTPSARIHQWGKSDEVVARGNPIFKLDDVLVNLTGTTLMVLVASKWNMTAQINKFPFAELNQRKLLLDVSATALYDADHDPVAPHGLFGQSYDGDNLAVNGKMDQYKGDGEMTTTAQAEGAIEGSISDYKIDSRFPFSTDFKYSRFNLASAKPRDVKLLTGDKQHRTSKPFKHGGKLHTAAYDFKSDVIATQ